jgi:hypothetical protein
MKKGKAAAGPLFSLSLGNQSGEHRILIQITAMKCTFPLALAVFLLLSCGKHSSSGLDNGTHLLSISCDSAGDWRFGYTGSSITSILPDANTSANGGRGTSQIVYTGTGSSQYVSLTSGGGPDTLTTLTYTLNQSKLPLSIDWAYTQGNSIQNFNEAVFVYGQTNMLDSVKEIFGYSSGPGGFDTIRYTYTFTYTGQNITRIVQQYVSREQNFILGIFTFNYGNTPNIFRHTDSLLYVYAYPITALFAQPMVVASFFAETFSASTFDSVSVYSEDFDPQGPATYSSKMTYSLNAAGKVTEEVFSESFFEGLAGKKFGYQ